MPDTQSFMRMIDDESFFTEDNLIVVTRAPGRLDVMGGIADYSGSLVLQLPIADATHIALQKLNAPQLRIKSLGTTPRSIEIDLKKLGSDYDRVRDYFADSQNHWAAYVAGIFAVLMKEKGEQFNSGASIVINSSVPEGKGVSSSAALEVSTMQAVNVAFNLNLGCRELATLCQKVENLIAGAPCGIMDQMTSACGEENRLLELLCQPDILKGTLSLSEDIELWGVDSGVRHSVSGSDYGTVRTAAFMGYRMIAEAAGLSVSSVSPGRVTIDDPKWHGYLANITPEEFESEFSQLFTEPVKGSDFLERYQGTTDTVTSVRREVDYPVLQATRHPIYEHTRVKAFASILKDSNDIAQLGRLMFESHQSYSDCGLGSDATDLIVELVRELHDAGLYGARITGGGSGGTVAVLGRRGSSSAIEILRERFQTRTGHLPLIISGSSPGASVFNHVMLQRGSSN